jgi:glucose/arabinose dehydrogenase
LQQSARYLRSSGSAELSETLTGFGETADLYIRRVEASATAPIYRVDDLSLPENLALEMAVGSLPTSLQTSASTPVLQGTLTTDEIVAVPLSVPGTLALELSEYRLGEDGRSLSINIVRRNGSSSAVTVSYGTRSGTAQPGLDYTAVTGEVAFASGETVKTVEIPILDDALREGDETFSFVIDNALGGAQLVSPRTATVVIVDNELPPGLVAYWKLDEPELSGGVNDATGSGNTGRYINIAPPAGSTTDVPVLGVTNPASLRLDGVDDYVAVPHSPSLNLTTQLTLAAWIKPEQFSNWVGIITKGTETSPYGMQLWSDGSLRFAVNQIDLGAGFGQGTWNSNRKLRLNQWNHVAITYDGSNLRFYLNGTLDENIVSVPLRFKSNTEELTLGVDLPGGDEYFRGFIDEARVYDRAISSEEVQALFRSQPVVQASRQVVQETVVAGFRDPVAIAWTPDQQTMLVAEKEGVVRVVQNGQTLNRPFIDISAQVNAFQDRGLMDVAVYPDFPNQPYVYLMYSYDPPETQNFLTDASARPDGNGNRAGRVVRYTADPSTGYTTAIPGSEVVLIGNNSTWDNFNGFVDSTVDLDERPGGIAPDGSYVQDIIVIDAVAHMGGALRFGADGALYISTGDGASYNRADIRGVRTLDVDSLSGKILRIDPITGEGLRDNPFFDGNVNSNRSKVYQMGLRNPFRFAIRPGTNTPYIGDVGWFRWEEINRGEPGANFGWPFFEGGKGESLRTTTYEETPQAQSFYADSVRNNSVVSPLIGLSHLTDSVTSLLLGDFYTGSAFPSEFRGDLFFGDTVRRTISYVNFDPEGNVQSIETFATDVGFVVDLKNAPDGTLYFVDFIIGRIGRLRFEDLSE